MKYGFIIDNRKCIGCHACTVACKSEHDVAIGVNRTWVKQVEKGVFPDTRRIFSVMRCNHCTDAPCVEICPTEALYIREDGIVDFNNERCIGCKSCMQACPYDSLYIDPKTSTAAKCNYCSHRIDVGLEPACVVICPEEAIVSGDMDNPNTKIAQLLSRQQVKVRKPEKSTKPNLFYIDGDESSLNPSVTDRSENYIWSSQAGGVGHYARYAQDASKKKSYEEMAKELGGDGSNNKPIEAILGSTGTRRVYDTPDKGILWGWEVSAYVFTKAISAGLILVTILSGWLNNAVSVNDQITFGIVSIVFLLATGLLLVKDLDQPKRFVYVLLRPHWSSWLVKGGYFITVFGALVSLWLASLYFEWNAITQYVIYPTLVGGILVAVYTAFLFAQARGRDFWQSPVLGIHMILHSVGAGAAIILTVYALRGDVNTILSSLLLGTLIVNLITVFFELYTPHPTEDSRRAAHMIVKGRYSTVFWGVVLILGNIIPIILLLWVPGTYSSIAASVLTMVGLYYTNKIWVEAPQRIPLT